MFKPVSSQLNVPLMEENILRFWQLRRVFARTTEYREGKREFVFYEGPPTANGKPGIHHIPARVIKDIFPRYKLMRGYHVRRRGGWDTHGLPVEIGVERQLGFTNKSQIEAFGVAKFNELCRASAFEFIQDWERFSERIAYWVDMQDAYVTFTNDYIESVWWILKNFWDKGMLYQGYRVVPYCPRCGTPLSDHEVAQGYSEAVDPSVFVRMPLIDEPGTSLLVWTTTPWTLPGNVAVAVHPELEYAVVQRSMPEGGRERLIVASALVDRVFGDEPVRVVDVIPGRKLKGQRYHPLFTFILPDKKSHYVVLQNYVTVEDGTGLVHIAPAFGAEDMQAAIDFDLPVLMTVDDAGQFVSDVRPWSGVFVKDADPQIIQDLKARGLLFHDGTTGHIYPFCWRCDTPLLYMARGTWYVRTSEKRDRLVALNQDINWIPSHIKEGRFGNWLENNVDWALGRERYWGTPLPIWECNECRHQIAVGAVAELSELAGKDLSDLELHRPFVDEIRFPCPECNGSMSRVPELIDVWFDSGAMPTAQWHFPFENQATFRQQFPADFICEAVDQTRGWFYSLHAISALLFNQVAFQNAISIGLFLDEEGRKMSKSRGNIIDPWELFSQFGADAFRWYLYTSGSPGGERRFSMDQVQDAIRAFTLPLWNIYAFFVTYANLDGWQPNNDALIDPEYTDLDRWLLSELHAMLSEVTAALERFDVPGATKPIQAFVDDLSKWYLRRSRRRFWKVAAKDETQADKDAAYATLYETLLMLSKILAPTMPFLSEALYQNLVRSVKPDAPISVHLEDWPEVNQMFIDLALNAEMRLVMKLASLGHSARSQAGIKVRQPLGEAAFWLGKTGEVQAVEHLSDLLADELNVKRVRVLDSASEVVAYQLKPLPKQLGSKYQSQFPAIQEAIASLDSESAAKSFLDGKTVQLLVDGEMINLLPDEVEVHLQAHPGLAVASEAAYLVALDTNITPELQREGLVRDFVRRVQELRKESDFDIADRIRLYVQATPNLLTAIGVHRVYIQGETLSLDILYEEPPEGIPTTEDWFEGEWLKVGVEISD